MAHPVRLYIWNVRPGGGPPGTRPEEEYRIQKMTRAPLELGGGRLTLLLGWYQPYDIFVAWDPAAHQYARYSVSIQVRAPYIQEANLLGMSVQYRDEPAENVVVVTADNLSSYIEHAHEVHSRQFNIPEAIFPEFDTGQIREEETTRAPVRRAPRVPGIGATRERRRVVNKLTRWWRSTTFPRAVTWAYDYRCTTCGIGLDLIEAAHIVPVSDPRTTEHPSNGLAFCPLHHDAYDEGIFGVTEDFRIVSNAAKIRRLEQSGRAGGLDVFLRVTPIGERIRLPDHLPYRPDSELLGYSLTLRGFR
jgi:putative restriction endonuclease